MALNASEVAALSRLLGDALALPEAEREAWFATLAADDQARLPRLREMLRVHADIGSAAALGSLPAIGRDDDAIEVGQAGEIFGPYRLVKPIGRGGMGMVWRAERNDGQFERQVAIKLALRSSRSGDTGVHTRAFAERLAREQQIVARLDHPRIARLYDAGVDAHGRQYLVMELVQGEQLRAYCRTHRLALHERVGLMVQICEAVSHAHRELVVHRDLKPSNILVDDQGGVKLLDFGIAKMLEFGSSDAEFSTAGHEALRAHTPRYAAPEQVAGGKVGTAADVYSLGIVLGELVDESRAPAAQAAALRAIAAKASQSEPGQRYPSAEHLAEDLRRWRADRPPLGVPSAAGQRLRLFLRRHRGRVVAAAAASVVLLGIGAVAAWQAWQSHQFELQSRQSFVFLADMLEDLEPGPGRTEPTGLQLLDRALERARERLADQPAVQGQVLVTLGMAYRRLGRQQQALEVLQQAVDRMTQALPADAGALQVGRAQLALQLSGDRKRLEPAAALAGQAIAACRGLAEVCARARGYGHAALMTVANRSNRKAEAIEHARQMIAGFGAAFGERSPEVLMGTQALAQLLRNDGALVQADAELQRVLPWAGSGVLRPPAERALRLTQALLDGDMGRLPAALQRYAALIESSTSDDERMSLQRLRAPALLHQGLADEALGAADAALALAATLDDPWEAANALPWRARALSLLGRHDAAREAIVAALQALEKLQLPAHGLEVLRARRIAAELLLRSGQAERALAELRTLRPTLEKAQPGIAETGAFFDLLGVAERQAGDAGAARSAHAAAAQALAGLPERHPLRLRHALYAALAAPPGSPAAALAGAAAQTLRAELPSGSVWYGALAPAADGVTLWHRLVL